MLEAHGGRHHFMMEGEGSAVVMIPGFTLDTWMWEAQATAFSQRHRVIRYDLRGAGKSSVPADPYRYEEDLVALLDHLEIETAHVIGLSLGGAIAIDFALTHPERVRSLVPVAASAVTGYPWPDEINQWFVGIGAAAARGDMARRNDNGSPPAGLPLQCAIPPWPPSSRQSPPAIRAGILPTRTRSCVRSRRPMGGWRRSLPQPWSFPAASIWPPTTCRWTTVLPPPSRAPG
ncbi:MAG: alpha/beta fold hydrolase [Rhizobiales bacterium]|nr:alpha/beta fold hydrolase [Hyphomicrobiales bacterium]MBI3672498.1 alpha/beta fold hydrolase [Hyphomicrobiales bacterium]